MIKSITVTNPKGEQLKLDLRNPENSGLLVKSISGLGPPKATVNSTELATVDGSVFSSARAQQRNIVLSLAMMLAPTIEDARLKTYRYFPLKEQVSILVETDRRKAEAFGIVESNEPDIFSKDESTQISIICPDPYFYDIRRQETVFAGVRPMFEFPFANESVTEDLLQFGEITMDTRANLVYSGDAETGILITIHARNDAKNVTLYNVVTRESMVIDTDKIETITGIPYKQGDDIIISTTKGNRYVQLLREGVYTNIISALDKDADWFQLTAGDNIFNFVAEEGQDDLMVTFSYRNAYGGV